MSEDQVKYTDIIKNKAKDIIRKIILSIIKLLEKILKKRIIITTDKNYLLNNTAALSKYGFWYAGDLFNMADISYGIATQGIVEKEETNLVIKILDFLSKEKNLSLYDIGANSGYYGILSAHLYKEKISVYSFEPLNEYYDCIEKSIYLNKLNNVKIFKLGLGIKKEEKTMYLAGSGSSFEKGFNGDIKNERKIQIDTLDNIISNEKIIPPNFIKIDVEGHELKILEGAQKTILVSNPVLFIEIAYSMKNIGRSYINKDYKKTFDILENMGYEVYKIYKNKLQKFNLEERPDGVNMYLFLNKDKHSELKNYILNEKFN